MIHSLLLNLFLLGSAPILSSTGAVIWSTDIKNLDGQSMCDVINVFPGMLVHGRQAMSKHEFEGRIQPAITFFKRGYRLLGLVSPAEMQRLLTMDAIIGQENVIYIVSIDDLTGAIVGVLRVESGRPRRPFNSHLAESRATKTPRISMEHKYAEVDGALDFLRDSYPSVVSFTNFYTRQDLSPYTRLRIGMDLINTALILVVPGDEEGDTRVLSEVIPENIDLLERTGFTIITDTPMTPPDGRVFMDANVSELYDTYVGQVARGERIYYKNPDQEGSADQAIAAIDQAMLSIHPLLRQVYTNANFAKAQIHYFEDDFAAMQAEVDELIAKSANDAENRHLELLAAIASSPYNLRTHQGNYKAVVESMDRLEDAGRLENLSEALRPSYVLFMRGLIAAQQEQADDAQFYKSELQNKYYWGQRVVDGRIHSAAKIDAYGWDKVLTLREDYFDETQVGETISDEQRVQIQRALAHAAYFETLNPIGLGAPLYDYQARLWKKLGNQAKQIHYERIAAILSID